MPAISRETDTLITGHGCDTVSTLLIGSQTGNSSNVYVNGLGVSVVGDPITPHLIDGGAPCLACPAPVTVSGSSTVFVNGKAVVRIGDIADQNGGGVVTSGSGNVFSN